MSDSIYRHDAIKAIETSRFLVDAKEKVMLLPTAQPYTDDEIQTMQDLEQAEFDKAFELGKEEGRKETQSKTGKWGEHGECPFCGYLRQWEDDKFCGNCGCRMLKEGEEHD